MPTFGICVPPEQASAAKDAGWNFVEGHVQQLFQGTIDDDAKWDGEPRVRGAALPTAAANCLVPGDLKIVGPDADLGRLKNYMTNVLRRAGRCGTTTLVFGSGAARNVPDGFDRARAKQQIIDFVKQSAAIAQTFGVTLVCEPLNRGECNIINSVAEGMEYVRAVNHPNFKCLVDSYHFWLENEPLENLRAAMPSIAHVHVADKDGRVAPGQSGTSDYRPFLKVLKDGGYNARISVESPNFKDAPQTFGQVLTYLKKAWAEA